jgi:hypothetical protein
LALISNGKILKKMTLYIPNIYLYNYSLTVV